MEYEFVVTLEMLKYEPVKYISKGEKAPIRIIGISIPKIAVKIILVLKFILAGLLRLCRNQRETERTIEQ